MRKNDSFGETNEKEFSFLKVIRTSYPNDMHAFELRPAHGSADPRGSITIQAKPSELLADLKRVIAWIEQGG